VQTHGMTLLLKDEPGVIASYKRHHRSVWPEVTAQLRDIGVREMRIYLAGRRLFLYMEAADGFDPGRDFATLVAQPTYRRWDELMRSLQEPAPEAASADWWASMDLVFDLNGQASSGE
jgi:L-rhamnose mutarotase